MGLDLIICATHISHIINNNNIFSAPYDALVVKASGLAAGKGVVVAETREEACRAVDDILGDKKYGTAGSKVVVEERLCGEEVSVSNLHTFHLSRDIYNFFEFLSHSSSLLSTIIR